MKYDFLGRSSYFLIASQLCFKAHFQAQMLSDWLLASFSHSAGMGKAPRANQNASSSFSLSAGMGKAPVGSSAIQTSFRLNNYIVLTNKKKSSNFEESFALRYSRVPNKHRPTFINFGSFFQGLRSYLRQLHYYLGVYVYCFSQFFPGSTLIWGPTLIRNSRVLQGSK